MANKTCLVPKQRTFHSSVVTSFCAPEPWGSTFGVTICALLLAKSLGISQIRAVESLDL